MATDKIYIDESFSVLDSYITPPNNVDVTSLLKPTITTGGTAAGYSDQYALNWNRAKIWKSTAFSGTTHYTMDFSATSIWSDANAVCLWFPSVSDSTLGFPLSALTQVVLQTSTTGAFAGEEVNHEILDNTNLYAFGAYSTIMGSRIWNLKMNAAIDVTVTPYVRVKFTSSASIQVEFAKIELCYFVPVEDIEGDPGYNFKNRQFVTTLESGGSNKYNRDFQRELTLPFKWMPSTFDAGLPQLSNIYFDDYYRTPLMYALDYNNSLEATVGQHIHTLPVLVNNGVDISMNQQFSQTLFSGATTTRYTEHL